MTRGTLSLFLHTVAAVLLAAGCAKRTPPAPVTTLSAPGSQPSDVGPSGRLNVSFPREALIIIGSLPVESMLNTLDANGTKFATCLEGRPVPGPGANQFFLKLHIANGGVVSEVELRTSSTDDPSVNRCITGVARALVFPPIQSKGIAITYFQIVVSS